MKMEYKIGDIIEGNVTGIQSYGVFISLDKNTQGLIHISECRHGYVTNLDEFIQIDDEVEAKIIDIDEYTGKISLSVRCLEKPFDFSKANKRVHYQHKKFWTNKHAQEGFAPIAERLDGWVKQALVDIDAGK